jgi:hypothetical protein
VARKIEGYCPIAFGAETLDGGAPAIGPGAETVNKQHHWPFTGLDDTGHSGRDGQRVANRGHEYSASACDRGEGFVLRLDVLAVH